MDRSAAYQKKILEQTDEEEEELLEVQREAEAKRAALKINELYDAVILRWQKGCAIGSSPQIVPYLDRDTFSEWVLSHERNAHLVMK